MWHMQTTANGVKGAVYQNVKRNTNSNSSATDLMSNNFRCNVGDEVSNGTAVVAIAAGSSVTFAVNVTGYHDGPIFL